jgi:hypothetical protein
MGLACKREIVGEAALAGDEPRILLARHRLADEAVAGFGWSGFVVHRAWLAYPAKRWSGGGEGKIIETYENLCRRRSNEQARAGNAQGYRWESA